jgi:hypothetical protein
MWQGQVVLAERQQNRYFVVDSLFVRRFSYRDEAEKAAAINGFH